MEPKIQLPQKGEFDNVNVCLAIPTMGLMDWQFVSAFRAMIVPCINTNAWTVRTMIDTARNMLVKQAKEVNIANAPVPKTTHILMIDDDHVFRPDLLVRLLRRDKDIVAALAYKRNGDFRPCCFTEQKDENGVTKYIPTLPSKFSKVDAIGTGAMLIKMEVFEKIAYPWFETYFQKDNPDMHWSVDFDFCVKARNAGYDIWCDPEIELGHLALPNVTGRPHFAHYLKNRKDTMISYIDENGKPLNPDEIKQQTN